MNLKKNNMELTGKIIIVQKPISGKSTKTGNPWIKQEYVLEIPGLFPRHFAFSVFGEDRIKQFKIQNGESLTVQFDIDAREHNGKWYNDFQAYTVKRTQVSLQPISDAEQAGVDLPFLPITPNKDHTLIPDDGSILPF